MTAAGMLDWLACRLAMPRLRRNPQPMRHSSLVGLVLLFAPGAVFALALLGSAADLARLPWECWAIALCGSLATLGGVGDWIFHKVYTTVGPHEHRAHVAALGAGGVVFVLMAVASVLPRPSALLMPVVAAVLVTATLICREEFTYHARCERVETGFHRILVVGNAAALLCWMHWIFVAGRPDGW